MLFYFRVGQSLYVILNEHYKNQKVSIDICFLFEGEHLELVWTN